MNEWKGKSAGPVMAEGRLRAWGGVRLCGVSDGLFVVFISSRGITVLRVALWGWGSGWGGLG